MNRIVVICLIFLITVSCTATQKSVKDETESEISVANAEAGLVVSEFILGAGDELEIDVYRHADLKKKVRISPDGMIFFPLIGEVKANGLSLRQFRDRIKEGLANYIVDAQISIEITAFKGQKIFVLGEVKNPGVYQLDPPITALEAISRAGGFTLDGTDDSVMLVRGGLEKPELRTLDLEKTLKEGDLTQNVALQRGDIVYVPRTFISNVDRFFQHMENILRPIVLLEQGIALYPKVEDVLTGKGGGDQSTTIIIAPR